MPPACEPRRSYRSSSPISIVTGWSPGSSRARAAPASGDGRKRPADPVAQGLAHDEVEVAAFEPRQFLGEQGYALAPGARHAGDVGAPEHALGAEGVETANAGADAGCGTDIRPRRNPLARSP